MQVKMQDIVNFSSFYNTVKDQKLSIKTAYKLAQLARAIENELPFYREKLQQIIQDFALLDDNGQPVPTDDGDGVKLRAGFQQECYAAMNDLQSVEVDLPDIKFTIDDFASVELTVTEMNVILPFLVE